MRLVESLRESLDEVARRAEHKQLKLSLGLSAESLRFREDCAATYGGAGGYANRVSGLGLAIDDLDPAIEFFTARNEDTKLELTSFAEPALVGAIGERGFTLRFMTHFLYARVAETPAPRPIAIDGISIERLDRTDPTAVRAAALNNERCFAAPESAISELTISLTTKHLTMPTNDTFVARENGQIVGVGCSESSDGTTLLFGGAVQPTHRGRGIQRALVAIRVALASERGSDLMVMMVGPGTSSERNGLRAGFRVGYARAFMARRRS